MGLTVEAVESIVHRHVAAQIGVFADPEAIEPLPQLSRIGPSPQTTSRQRGSCSRSSASTSASSKGFFSRSRRPTERTVSSPE